MSEKVQASILQDGELELINQYTRRHLSATEVFVFSVVLCDNDVDRDYERFTVASLEKLSELFVGKTGFLEQPNAQNCTARIISCTVLSVWGKKTKLGDDLFQLVARAFIPKTLENADIIDRIKDGTIKEVSVGCSVSKTKCSICGEEITKCSHKKGIEYVMPNSHNVQLCCGELHEPYDAYEFAFVPAAEETKNLKPMERKRLHHEEFEKFDLNNLMVVENRQGERFMVVGDNLIGMFKSALLSDYKDDLCCRHNNTEELDIIKVYDTIPVLGMLYDPKLTLLWERELALKVTRADIEEKFGCRVEIVD